MEPIFVIQTAADEPVMITYRQTRQEAEAFTKVYNINRHHFDLAEIIEVEYI